MKKYFDKIYCISTPGANERWERTLKEFKKLGVLKSDIKKISELFPTGVVPHTCLNDVWVKIAKDAKANNYKRIIIFEDDFEVLDLTTFDTLKNDLDKYGNDWDLFYLGGIYIQNIKEIRNQRPIALTTNGYLKKYPKHFQRITKNLLELDGGLVSTAHSIAVNHTMFDLIIDFPKYDNRLSAEQYTDFIDKNNTTPTGIGPDLVLIDAVQKKEKHKVLVAHPPLTKSIPNVSLLNNKNVNYKELNSPLYRAISRLNTKH